MYRDVATALIVGVACLAIVAACIDNIMEKRGGDFIPDDSPLVESIEDTVKRITGHDIDIDGDGE